METRVFSKSWFSSVISYSILFWTILCFVGTWFVILKYGILFEGLIAVVVTFFFAATLWVIPLTGLTLLSLLITPSDESHPFVTFKELIQKGIGKVRNGGRASDSIPSPSGEVMQGERS